MRKTCKTCNNEFETNSNRQIHCSDACKFGEATCRQCGNRFIKKDKTTGEFCSRDCWYKWPGRIPDRMCPVCEKPFRPKFSRQKTCSYECGDQIKRTAKRNTHCEQCGKALRKDVHPRVRFCSRSCAMTNRDRRGQLHAPEGTVRPGPNGYNIIKRGKKWVLEHRDVMERHLGRPLEPYERVHHKFGNRSDNRPSKLELWVVKGRAKKDPAGQRLKDLLNEAADQLFTSQPSTRDEILNILYKTFRIPR